MIEIKYVFFRGLGSITSWGQVTMAQDERERDEERESARAAGPEGGAWRGISQNI